MAVLDKDEKKKRRGRKRKKPASGNGAVTDAIPIRGLIPGMAVHFANCCHPLPGDRIIGIQTRGKGVAVHTIDCGTLSLRPSRRSHHEARDRSEPRQKNLLPNYF